MNEEAKKINEMKYNEGKNIL